MSRPAGPRCRARVLASAAFTLSCAAVLLAGCASTAGWSTRSPLTSIGPGEGTLRLIGVSGDVEDGSIDPRVDWVTSFQHRTGCRVSYTQVPSAGSIAATIRRRGAHAFDGFMAPPVVASQLIGAGQAAPLNTALIDGYAAITPVLRAQQAVRAAGKTYGVPYMWSAYVLGYAPSAVRPTPAAWSAVFNPASAARYAGKIILPDSPLTIALAALYLKSVSPSLGITDPYELTSAQFGAATGLLRSERRTVGQYYSTDPQIIQALATGSAVLGPLLPRHVDIMAKAGRDVAAADPAQGTTGSVSFWMLSAKAPDPDCMYKWLAWSITPRVQQEVAQWNGAAPVTPAACTGLGRKICGLYHVGDQAYLSKVAFAHLPSAACRNGSHGCAPWNAWENAWNSITSSSRG